MAEIENFEIRIKLDCTISVDNQDWLKPGVESGIRWRIRDNDLPSEDQVQTAVEFLQRAIIGPSLEDVIGQIHSRTREMRDIR